MLKKLKGLFTDHPAYNGESYLSHMAYAFIYSALFFSAGIACLIHAIFPFLFTTTGSNIAKFILSSVKSRGDYL